MRPRMGEIVRLSLSASWDPIPWPLDYRNLVDVSIYRIGLLNLHASALHSAADLSTIGEVAERRCIDDGC